MTTGTRSAARRASAIVIAVGVVMTAAGLVGALTAGGSGDPEGRQGREGAAVPPPSTAAASPSAREAPTPPPPTAPPESVPEFFVAFARAFAANDDEFLFARLHPLVRDRYGDEQCRAYLGRLDVPAFALEVVEVGGQAPWDWALDGRSDPVPDAVSVRLRTADDGVTFRESEAHVVVVDGQVRWFTDCGTPI